jgi:hypothetical protein
MPAAAGVEMAARLDQMRDAALAGGVSPATLLAAINGLKQQAFRLYRGALDGISEGLYRISDPDELVRTVAERLEAIHGDFLSSGRVEVPAGFTVTETANATIYVDIGREITQGSILSFAMWGIGDYAFLRSGDDTAIQVGDRKIPVQQLDAEYRQARDRIKRMLGNEVDENLLRQFGVLDQTVDRLAGQAALDAEISRLGLVAGDAVVRQRIAGDPSFRGPGGQFDRFVFQRVLYENGFTEQRFIELVRADIVRQQVIDAIEAGVRPPETLVESIYRHRNEKRSGERIHVANASFDDVGTPNDADLARTYEANGERFTAPELRTLSVVRVGVADVAATVVIDERKGRRWAELHGLRVTGSLGLLLALRRRQLIPSLRLATDRLAAKGIHLEPVLVSAVLEQEAKL